MTQIAASSASARLSAFRRFLARLLCAIVVSLWSAVVACSQAVPPLPLPEALRAHVKDERFDAVTSIKGLPVGVHLALGNLFGSGALEEVGTEFQVTDVNPRVPPRRLVTAGCSIEHCLVYYEHVARGAVSLDGCRDSIRVGRYCASRSEDNRRRSKSCSIRSGQGDRSGAGDLLVVLESLIGSPVGLTSVLAADGGRSEKDPKQLPQSPPSTLRDPPIRKMRPRTPHSR
jgi:hypothetical protein